MTLGDVRDYLREELKADRNGKIWGDNQLNRFINKAILNISVDANFAWDETDRQSYSFTTTSGTQEYALPSDFGQLELVILNDGQNKMYLKSTDFVDQKIANLNSSDSKPYNYYIRTTYIGFSPIPDNPYEITLFYRKGLSTLTNDSDTFPFSDDFLQAVLKYASYMAWSSVRGNRQSALEKLEDYKMEMDYLLQRYLSKDFPGLNYRTPRNKPNTSYKGLSYYD